MISVSFYKKFEIFQDIEKALLQQKKFLECLRFSLGMDAPNTCVYVFDYHYLLLLFNNNNTNKSSSVLDIGYFNILNIYNFNIIEIK